MGFAAHSVRLARHGADLRRGAHPRLVPLGQRFDVAHHHHACPDQFRSHARNCDQGGVPVVIATDPAALGARAEAMILELAAISAEPGRLVRLFLTPEHRRAADLVAGWMRAAGLTVSEDALGTVRGRFGETKRRLLIGSHIDTVIDAGKYDGPLGVIAGILAAEQFARTKVELPFGIDVLAFGDEEGSRFPVTLTSSSACAGVFRDTTLSLADRDGVTLRDAIKAYGKDPAAIASAAYGRDEVAAYVEVHIEQGPVLEARNQP